MPNINDVYSGDTLKASDLNGREWSLIIRDVRVVEFDDGHKLAVDFERASKALICNKTNANIIAEQHGMNTDGWIGKQITLYETRVDYQGKRVPAIRVRDIFDGRHAQHSQAPLQQPQQAPPPAGPDFSQLPPAHEAPAPTADDLGARIDDEVPFAPEWRG